MDLTLNQKLIHTMFVGYNQQPANPDDLANYLDLIEQENSWKAATAVFAESDTFQSLFGDKDREETVAEIYQFSFDRAAAPEEVAFWADSDFSDVDLIFAIVNGAQNADKATVENKVNFSAELASQLGDDQEAFDELSESVNLNTELAGINDGSTVSPESVSQLLEDNGVSPGDGGEGGEGAAVTLNASNDGDVVDAADADTTFTIESGAFTVGIENFEQGDTLAFFDTPDVQNTAIDGEINFQATNSETGEVTVVQLTGLDQTVEAAVTNLTEFTDEFGADALAGFDGGNGGDGGDSGGPTETLTLGASDDGTTVDAASADTTFTVESGAFTVGIENFEQGDALDFFDTPDVQNTAIDGEINLQATNSETGEVAVVQLTGLDQTVEAAVTNLTEFTEQFGADALV